MVNFFSYINNKLRILLINNRSRYLLLICCIIGGGYSRAATISPIPNQTLNREDLYKNRLYSYSLFSLPGVIFSEILDLLYSFEMKIRAISNIYNDQIEISGMRSDKKDHYKNTSNQKFRNILEKIDSLLNESGKSSNLNLMDRVNEYYYRMMIKEIIPNIAYSEVSLTTISEIISFLSGIKSLIENISEKRKAFESSINAQISLSDFISGFNTKLDLKSDLTFQLFLDADISLKRILYKINMLNNLSTMIGTHNIQNFGTVMVPAAP